jgi:hypothetical protein
MERTRDVIISNVQSVSQLALSPTHQLRVLNATSCLPEIVHETRFLPAMIRVWTGDSRHTIIQAFKVTLDFIEAGVLTDRYISPNVKIHCEQGLRVLRNRYEDDINTCMLVDALILRWSRCQMLPHKPLTPLKE